VSTRIQPPARRRVGRPGDGEDVRGAILAATLRQLGATGSPDRVTIAAIVDEAGCTPPSLYHYWPKRELLLQEASARGWEQFRASQTVAVADQHDPIDRLRLRGRAYLDFALAKPALFRVLFLGPAADGPTDPPAAEPAKPSVVGPTDPQAEGHTEPPADTGNALHDLITDVVAGMATGKLRPADPLITALALWSAMHGVATLWAVTPNLPTDLAHSVGDLAQDAILTGLAPAPQADDPLA
jgi:AcrR family transcriptional regulator